MPDDGAMAAIEAQMHADQTADAFSNGLQAALSIVRTRKAHYELYRCDCLDRDPGNGHRPGCKGETMSTHPATFVILDEIATFIEAAIIGVKRSTHEAIRREAFVQGFVAARDPKTAMETLLICTDADTAYGKWRTGRTTKGT